MPAEIITLDKITRKLILTIAEETGNDLEDIFPESYLEDELGISQNDLRRLVVRINHLFNIKLDFALIADTETVEELAILIKDEADLG